ncbi:MAG: hypothetical protein JEY91_10060 [Spirochaetaceae bacterium]|nr:hypothetical protein [Spirochaetaceae bacterium]
MKNKLDELYENYKDYSVTFNQNIIESLGLIAEQISFKCGGRKVPCIIYSSTMTEARLLAKLDQDFFQLLQKQRNTISLRYSFFVKDQNREISFFINSKIRNYSKYNCDNPDLYFISLEFINKSPDDLIKILGTHVTKEATNQKRAEKRIILGSDSEGKLGLNIMENYLFISGNGTPCVLTELSIFSAKVLINGVNKEFKPGVNVMLLMKAKGLKGVGEMVGSIERVDLINEAEELFSIIITFNQEMVPPTYMMWIAECIEMIKIKPSHR